MSKKSLTAIIITAIAAIIVVLCAFFIKQKVDAEKKETVSVEEVDDVDEEEVEVVEKERPEDEESENTDIEEEDPETETLDKDDAVTLMEEETEDISFELGDGVYNIDMDCSEISLSDDALEVDSSLYYYVNGIDEVRFEKTMRHIPLADDFEVLADENPGEEGAELTKKDVDEFRENMEDFASWGMLTLKIEGGKLKSIMVYS